METARESLKKLKTAISSNERLQRIMREGQPGSIEPGVTTKPRLNMSALNSQEGINSFITLSFNKVEGYENEAAYYLKVGVATDVVDREDPADLVLAIVGELNSIITQRDLNFGFAEQYSFGEMEETYFDLDQNTWGYVIIYGVSDSPI